MQPINWRTLLKLMFLRDWPWKLLSLTLACMIYFPIRAQITHYRVISVPVDVVFDAASTGAVIESVEPRSVQVTLRGSYTALSQLNPETIQFDISPRRKKSNTAQVDSEIVKLRPYQLMNINRLRVAGIEPSAVLVRFDVPMSLQLNVAKPEVTGTARGQVKLTYDLTNAVVTGSHRLLATLNTNKVQVHTTPIDIEGRTQSFQTRVTLSPPGDPTRLKVVPPEMLVNVQITTERATTRIENVPVHFMPPSVWTYTPQHVALEVTGSPEEMARIKPDDFTVIANAASDSTNRLATLTVLVRQGTTVTATADPDTVELTPPPEQ